MNPVVTIVIAKYQVFCQNFDPVEEENEETKNTTTTCWVR